jgi:hypothetical protein
LKRFVLALLFVALAAPAFAGTDFPYSSFGAELDKEGSWDNAVELTPEPGFFGTVDLAGGMKISLDRTSLLDISAAFGNAVQTYQYVGYTTSWLCYTAAGRRVWFIADLTYETTDDVNVGSITDEPADPATDELFRCLPEPKAMLARQATLPVVGASRDELNARFKANIPSGATQAGGMRDSAAEGNGVYDTKIVTYRLTNDVVDAIRIAEDYMAGEEGSE